MKLNGTSWVLVPRVATEEMYDAAKAATWIGSAMADRCYRTMLAAAPQPPVEEIAAEIAEIISVAQVMGNASITVVARAIVKRLMGDNE